MSTFTISNGKKMGNIFFRTRFLYFFGLVLAIAVTAVEVLKGSHDNFLVFAGSTLDFWKGLDPYTARYAGREFLYTPVFSVLFTPFALFPDWLGAFVWNIFNYSMFFLAVKTLPEKYFTHETRCRIFLFTLPLVAQTMFSFQYNLAVAYIFIAAWSLLEKDKPFWAVLLVMVSGLTKIYGIFELALLVCYPKFWRNIFYAIAIGAVLLVLPILSPHELMPYYSDWLTALDIHQSSRIFQSFFFAEPFSSYLLPHFRAIQIGSLVVLAVLFLLAIPGRNGTRFRVQSLGILMGWVVLMSDSAEIHTYLIAIAGMALWYWSREKKTTADKVMLWANFLLFCIVPVDILCPVPVMHLLHEVLWLHVYVFFFSWVRMIVLTMIVIREREPRLNPVASDDAAIDIVCPCYNPHDGFIGKLSEGVLQIRALHPQRRMHLIVSDDGSTKGFGEDVRNALLEKIADAEIVLSPHRGKGSAVRAGIAASTAPFTVYTDIDMPYSAISVKKITDILVSGYDLAIAVRTKEYYGHLTPFRKLLSFGSKMMNRMLLGISHCDAQGGLKGLSENARDAMLRTTVDGFLFDTEFVRNATRDRLAIKDINSELNEGVRMSSMGMKVMMREMRSFIRIFMS